MRKFLSFLYRFASIIIMIVGVVAAVLLAISSGEAMTANGVWSEPSKDIAAVVFFSISVGGLALMTIFGFLSIFAKKLKFLSKFGMWIIFTLSFLLILAIVVDSALWFQRPENSWTSFPTSLAKLKISLFSIGVILLSMNVVFGIILGIWKKPKQQQANA